MLRGSSNTSEDRLRKMQDLIAKKAFELYEKRGGQHGSDLEDWLEAERIVRRSMRS